MAHRIIISSSSAASLLAEQHGSTLDYEVSFAPAHALPENVVDKRIAKARRVLNKLSAEMCAPAEPSED